MVICGDTSFLFSLYGNDANSPRAVTWVRTCRSAISLSPFNAYEIGNALRFAEFRKLLTTAETALYWSQFQTATRQGRLRETKCKSPNRDCCSLYSSACWTRPRI